MLTAVPLYEAVKQTLWCIAMNNTDINIKLQRFKQYNEYRLVYYNQSLSTPQRDLLNCLSIFFHINPSFVPCCSNPDMPCGIKNYDIDNIEIENRLKNIEPLYRYQDEDRHDECKIEGLYLQECYKNEDRLLWLVFSDSLSQEEKTLLNRKAMYVEKLLHKKHIKIKIFLTAIDHIEEHFYQYFDRSYHIDKTFLIEEFYAETIVIAGKIPAWWFYEEAILNSISTAGDDNYLYIKNQNNLRIRDYYSAVIWQLLGITKNPISTWLELLLILHHLTCKDGFKSFSAQLRSLVLQGSFESESVDIKELYANYIKSIIRTIKIEDQYIINHSFLEILAQQYSKDNITTVFDFISNPAYPRTKSQPISLTQYIEFINKIYKLTESLFTTIQEHIAAKDEVIFNEIKELEIISENLLFRLKRSYNSFHLMPEIDRDSFYQDRVNIKFSTTENNKYTWKLYSTTDNRNELIKKSNNIIELLSWAFINQIIDTGTQISSNGPANIMSALDMVNIIAFISANTETKLFDVSDLNAYSAAAFPVKSLIFINQNATGQGYEESGISQLNIFNTGEFQVAQYKNYDDFAACIHGWHYSSKVEYEHLMPDIQVMAIKPGESQEIKSSLKNLITITGTKISDSSLKDTRIIFKKMGKYFVSHARQGDITTHSLQNTTELYKYLEKPLEFFTNTAFINVFEQSPMLEYLLKQNTKGVIQLFYMIEDKRIQTFVFDETGALFTYKQSYFRRQSYINNWMLFIRNTLKHLDSNQAVEINQLLKMDAFTYEHVKLNGNMLPNSEECYALDLCVEKVDNNIEITFKHKDKQFKSNDKGADLYTDIYLFISRSLSLKNKVPVYIADIKIDKSVMMKKTNKSPCLFDYLNYKRNVEYRLNQKINGLT